jgi:hypothetical protein
MGRRDGQSKSKGETNRRKEVGRRICDYSSNRSQQIHGTDKTLHHDGVTPKTSAKSDRTKDKNNLTNNKNYLKISKSFEYPTQFGNNSKQANIIFRKRHEGEYEGGKSGDKLC